jgi:hypothetical protein
MRMGIKAVALFPPLANITGIVTDGRTTVAVSQKRGSRLGPVTNLGDALPARRSERDWSTQEDCGER